ncbi:MAG: hypothetical protein P8N76_17425 [Pirellulaceae bacterium]|nr:hypothetical protein [Pirellulaceae bacterium]
MSTKILSRRLFTIVAGFSLARLVPMATSHGQVRTYDAHFVAVGPTIDGTIAPNEWDAAASGGETWTLLRTLDGGEPNEENNRFRALWNQEGRYILGESDYGEWGDDFMGQNPAGSDFAGDFFNVFLDPNTLEADNIGQFDNEVDNY